MSPSKSQLLLVLKGFCMGAADIVPGVSGGTVALVTGIYNELIATISSVNKDLIRSILKFDIRAVVIQLNLKFLIPLMVGIFSAILGMARIIHFCMQEYPHYTWSLFFGLIGASVILVGKMVENFFSTKNIISFVTGTIIGLVIVSAIPVQTSNAYPFIFLAGSIAICAMILPGISGSFILLILGKYAFVTSALKNPFLGENLLVIIVFAIGCLFGLIAFSKLLNFLLKNYYNIMLSLLMGFMLGSMKKIWPWKETIESVTIRGKEHTLSEALIFPSDFNLQVVTAFGIMLSSFIFVCLIDYYSHKSRSVSSAG